MLSKEEREGIANRLNYCNDTDYYSFYRAVTGQNTTTKITLDEDINELKKIIFDLCDTSNMVELPLDKDGQVIHIGDTLYDNDGAKITVCSIRFNESINNVVITCEGSDFVCSYSADNLTRKNPVSVQSISKRMQGVLEDYLFSVDSDLHTELVSIADQLKELAGKDEE
jgi:hypothetical protein|nr:MAG TPA: hypothetical protein [Bacteriophage sp.]